VCTTAESEKVVAVVPYRGTAAALCSASVYLAVCIGS